MKKICFLIALSLSLFVFGTDEVIAQESTYFIHSDHLGSTTLITQNGSVVEKNLYYPYGTERTQIPAGSQITEKTYTGQTSDVLDTNLMYYNARYYNPTLAKFTQADTANDRQNGYEYVSNNPIAFKDLSGNEAVCANASFNCSPISEYLDNDFFNNLWKTYEQNQKSPLDSFGTEQLFDSWSRFVNQSIPYSQKELEMLQNWQENGGNYKGVWSNMVFNSYFRQNVLMKYSKTIASAYGEYRGDLFICNNFSQLTTAYLIENTDLDGIQIFSTFNKGHEFITYIEDGRVMVIDPTFPVDPNTSLFEYIIDTSLKNFQDWSYIDYWDEYTNSNEQGFSQVQREWENATEYVDIWEKLRETMENGTGGGGGGGRPPQMM